MRLARFPLAHWPSVSGRPGLRQLPAHILSAGVCRVVRM